MQKKLIKNLLLLLTMVALCFAVGVTASAEERTIIDSGECGADGDNVIWTLYNDGELVISGEGEMKIDELNYQYPWDCYTSKINSVIVNTGITNIPTRSFNDCRNLTKVYIGDSVKKIESSAFQFCDNLSNVYIGKNVEIIGSGAFGWCSFDNAIIPDSVTHIESQAFYCCSNLSEITIGGNIVDIGIDAFEYTAYAKNQNNWDDGMLYIGDYLVKVDSSLDSYTLKNGTLGIAAKTFYRRTDLANLIIPNTVIGISELAFAYCSNLTDLYIGNNITHIGTAAFAYCPKLKIINLPNLVQLGNCAFAECDKLENLILSDKIGVFYIDTVYGCDNLTSLTILSSKCKIISDLTEISPPSNFSNKIILSGYINSSIEQYANENNYHFLPLDGENAGIVQNHQYPTKWNEVLPATCTERGLTLRVCRTCCEIESKVLPYTEHTYSDEFIVDCESTCTTEGKKSRHCIFCDAKTEETTIPLAQHTEQIIPGYASDCINPGLTDGLECAVCKEVIRECDLIDELGHDMGDFVVTISPTCQSEGEEMSKCSRCEEAESRTIDMLSHEAEILGKKDATCTETGLTAGAICKNCNTILIVQEIIGIKDHTDTDGNYKCDMCLTDMTPEEPDTPTDPTIPEAPKTPSDPTKDCDCNCHADGIKKFFFDFILFFQKLFRQNKECACGTAHY